MVKKLLKSGCEEHFQLLNEGEVSCKIIFLSPLCFRDPEFSTCYSFSLSCKSSSPHKQKRRTMEILTSSNDCAETGHRSQEPTDKTVENFITSAHSLLMVGQDPPAPSPPGNHLPPLPSGNTGPRPDFCSLTEHKHLSASSLNTALKPGTHCGFGATDVSAVCNLPV